MLSKTIEDKIEERLYEKLSEERNNVAIAYLFEIISLESEYFYLCAKYLKERDKYLKYKDGGVDREKDIIDDYWIFSQNLIYRYYSLLQKLSQLINTLWIKRFKEKDCTFDKINSICKKEKEFEFLSQKLNKVNIKPVLKILGERKNIVHRRVVEGKGSLFTSHILPLGGEGAKEFLKWEKESRQVLDTAYKNTFQAIESVLAIYIKK